MNEAFELAAAAAKLPPPRRPQKPWMQTYSGRVFPLLACTPADVHWPDVAWHLAHCNRFAGAAGAYSVAQHSVLVAHLVPHRLRARALLHDAEEFAIGDITQPTNQALIALGIDKSILRKLKHTIRYVIHRAAGIFPPGNEEDEALIKKADNIALATEKRDLLAAMPDVANEDWLHGVAHERPADFTLTAWAPADAARAFADHLKLYCGVE